MVIKKVAIGFFVLVSAFALADEKKLIAPDTKVSALSEISSKPDVSADKKLNEAEIKLKITSHVPRAEVISVKQSSIPNLYQVDTNMGIIYMTHDGNYFVEGDLYTFTDTGIKNLSEAELNEKRKTALAQQDPKQMIIFSPPKDKIKATITVFTDIDCGYCRKLHSGMKQMNDLGIEVRYMAFPRAGLDSKSYTEFVSVWCSANQQEALTTAKSGKEIPTKTCDNPVAKQYTLGASLGITGTPGIIMADGTLLPGYLPPEQLAQELGIAKRPNLVEVPVTR